MIDYFNSNSTPLVNIANLTNIYNSTFNYSQIYQLGIDFINYYIEHDYNITSAIYGRGASDGQRVKRWSFVGLFENSLHAVVKEAFHILETLIHNIIEPIIEKSVRVILSTLSSLIDVFVKLILDIFSVIVDEISKLFTSTEFVSAINHLIEKLLTFLHRIFESLIDLIVSANDTHLIFEFLAILLLMIFIFRMYLVSLAIAFTIVSSIGFEREGKECILILIISLSLLYVYRKNANH